MIESIATKVAQNINKSKLTVLYEFIKVGDVKTKGRTININAFHQSLFGIVENYLVYKEEPIESIDVYYEVIEDITFIISRAWEIITYKWEECYL